MPLRDVAGLCETPQVSERWHNGSDIVFLVCSLRDRDGGVIYTLELQEERVQPEPPRIPPRATPAQEPLTLQERRAAQRGRGRKARAPPQIPWRGWKDIFVCTYYEILDDRLLALAAGIAFYSLVALFPAIAAGVSVYALFANAATISKHLSIAADIVPAGTLDLLGEEISRIAAKSDGKRTFGFLFGLGIALWSANAGMKAIFDALNIIYDEEEKRGFIWLNVVSLFFTICVIAGAGLVPLHSDYDSLAWASRTEASCG